MRRARPPGCAQPVARDPERRTRAIRNLEDLLGQDPRDDLRRSGGHRAGKQPQHCVFGDEALGTAHAVGERGVGVKIATQERHQRNPAGVTIARARARPDAASPPVAPAAGAARPT